MEWLYGLAVPFGVGILFKFVPNSKLEAWGIKLGKLLSKFGRSKLGKTWEAQENKFTDAIVVFAEGIRKGADLDDKVPVETKGSGDGPDDPSPDP